MERLDPRRPEQKGTVVGKAGNPVILLMRPEAQSAEQSAHSGSAPWRGPRLQLRALADRTLFWLSPWDF